MIIIIIFELLLYNIKAYIKSYNIIGLKNYKKLVLK